MITAEEARSLYEIRSSEKVEEVLEFIESLILEADVPCVAIDDDFNRLTSPQRGKIRETLEELGYTTEYINNVLYIHWADGATDYHVEEEDNEDSTGYRVVIRSAPFGDRWMFL
jgi:hypothetical protein